MSISHLTFCSFITCADVSFTAKNDLCDHKV